jgi:sugar porter (SP) family MFS transporter
MNNELSHRASGDRQKARIVMQGRLFFWSLTAALAGFLFGFDTVVISGAEKTIQDLWGLAPALHGLAISMALWGTVLGSLLGGWPTERFGRRKTLLWIGILYFVSAVGSAYAPEVISFMIARFIGGLGVGISTVAAPLYIAEIAPARYRGRLAGMFQFNIVFGILIAFLSNALLGGVGENAWRWMLGVEAIPAFLYTVLCFGIPESPRWLIAHSGQRAAGIDVFRQINPDVSEKELEATADEIAAGVKDAVSSARFWTARLKTPIILAFLIAFFNQLSGINAILYFAPRIFTLTGLSESAALLQSVGIGVTNLIFTFVGLYLIDRLGRRTLLYIGSFGYIASLGLCAWAFFTYAPQFDVASKAIALSEVCDEVIAEESRTAEEEAALETEFRAAIASLVEASSDRNYEGQAVALADASPGAVKEAASAALDEASELAGSGGKMVLLCIFAFIAAHAVGQGAVIWVFIGEIFPNRNRASGQALGSFTHWIFAATLTLVFPKVIEAFPPGYVFGFFCLMMVLQLVWVKLMVPETKGVPLEEMEKQLGIQMGR